MSIQIHENSIDNHKGTKYVKKRSQPGRQFVKTECDACSGWAGDGVASDVFSEGEWDSFAACRARAAGKD